MVLVIVLAVILVSLLFFPKWTAAIGVALVVMFLYVWIFDPQCQNVIRAHPELYKPEMAKECGIKFAKW